MAQDPELPMTDGAGGSGVSQATEELVAESGAEIGPEAGMDESGAALEHLRSEIETLTDRHLRLAAEFDNYRRRVERERAEYRVRAQADLVLPLLDLLDDLQRVAGLDSDRSTVASILEGVQLIEKKFRHTLESAGLEPIDAEGEFFDPATMEALMTVPAERPEDDEMVADVFQRGYRFKETLIRPARVRVKKYDS
jgi:molecular chaperone GrpE